MKLLTTTAALALCASTAFAAGPVTSPIEPAVIAPPAPTYDWTGFYAGGQLGFGNFETSTDFDGDGLIGGIHAGYMWDFGNWVLGGELDYDITSDVEFEDPFGVPADDEVNYVARLKLRAGYDAGRTLIYATAGPAWTEITSGGADFSDSGWFAGVGVSYLLNNDWMVGGEILTHQFDDFDNSGVDVDATTVTLRASYRF